MGRTIGIIIMGMLNVLTLVFDFFLVWLLIYILTAGFDSMTLLFSIIIVTLAIGVEIVKWVAFYYIVKLNKIKWLIFYCVYSWFIFILLLGFRFLSLFILLLLYLSSIFLIFYNYKQTIKNE